MKLAMKLWILGLAIFISACGPKEIGEGTSDFVANPPDPAAAESLRYPITGMNATQRLLYWQNHPDVMQNVQAWRREQFRRYMGLAPSPEDPAYRQIPKMRSPFRQ